MTDTITITHVITKNSCATTVALPGMEPITKTWRANRDSGYTLDTAVGWDEEPTIPSDLAYEVERAPINLCSYLED